MKFKVGDKVRIRKNLISGTWFHDCLVTRDMCEMGGKEAVIRMARGSSYFLSTKGTEWSWTDEMLEPAEESSGSSDEKPDVMFPAFQEDNGMPHTPHYMNGLIETIDVIKMALTPEEFKGFLKGNVLKYELRAPYKHETPDADYQKAKDYFNLLEEENQ